MSEEIRIEQENAEVLEKAKDKSSELTHAVYDAIDEIVEVIKKDEKRSKEEIARLANSTILNLLAHVVGSTLVTVNPENAHVLKYYFLDDLGYVIEMISQSRKENLTNEDSSGINNTEE